MKKFAKMSLVAALAVAGTTASAVDLAEAIKGVDISGNITYEYQDTNDKRTADSDDQINEYDMELTAKVPVNDMVTAVVKFDVALDTNAEIAGPRVSGGDLDVHLEDVYFSINTGYATVNAGQQNLPTNFTDGMQGTGVVALVPAGPVTLAAGYFNEHNHPTVAIQGNNVAAAGILGSVGPVNFEGWYADVSDVLDAYELKASMNVMDIATVGVRYSEEDPDAVNTKDAELLAIEVAGSVGPVNLSAAYGSTNKGNTTVGIDNDQDAGVGFELSQASIHDLDDATAWKIGANMDVMEGLNLAVDYFDAEYTTTTKDDSDMDELKLTATYNMSSNFKVTTYVGFYEDTQGTTKIADNQRGALELKYSF